MCPPVAGWFVRTFLGGQARHDDELEAGMADGLRRIKTIIEESNLRST